MAAASIVSDVAVAAPNVGVTKTGEVLNTKFVVVVPVLYFINKHVEDKEFRNFMLLIVLILGLAPASRNLARLMVGV